MEIIIGADGKPMPCFCIDGNQWFACSEWTQEEAEEYVRTGKYPQRLSDEIREEFLKQKETQDK